MEEIITLDYGSGGKKTSALISELLLPAFDNSELGKLGDGAILSAEETLCFSTDSFVVSPRFFPGGDIGKLCVCGTVNDLCMCGGEPKYLSLSFIIEEGLPLEELSAIVSSIKDAANLCKVSIVTGDTKVVERGRGDGIYINTAGIGFLRYPNLSPDNIRVGDAVLVSGTVGDHGAAVMLARDELMTGSDIVSDCAPLNELTGALFDSGAALRVLRDPTRGGVATTLCEFAENRAFSIELNESDIPVSPSVAAACDILGLDPLYSANEGKLLCIVPAKDAGKALAAMKSVAEGKNAAIIGYVTDKFPGKVTVKTALGASRVISKLSGAQLPRIC